MGLLFDGTSQSVNTAYAPNYGIADSFTIACWVKFVVASTYDVIVGAIGAGGSADSMIFFGLGSTDATLLRFAVRDELANVGTATTATGKIANGTWYHIAAVRDVPNDLLRLYLNGVEENNTADLTATNVNLSDAPLFIGDRNNAYDTLIHNYANAVVDDVAIWSVALSANQISTLVKSKRRLAPSVDGVNLVRWWPLSGPNGVAAAGSGTVLDYSKNSGHGTQVNGPLYQATPLSWPSKAHVHWVGGAAPATGTKVFTAGGYISAAITKAISAGGYILASLTKPITAGGYVLAELTKPLSAGGYVLAELTKVISSGGYISAELVKALSAGGYISGATAKAISGGGYVSGVVTKAFSAGGNVAGTVLWTAGGYVEGAGTKGFSAGGYIADIGSTRAIIIQVSGAS